MKTSVSQKSSKLLTGHHKLSSPPEWSLGQCHILILLTSLWELSRWPRPLRRSLACAAHSIPQCSVVVSHPGWNDKFLSSSGNPNLRREAQAATKSAKLTGRQENEEPVCRFHQGEKNQPDAGKPPTTPPPPPSSHILSFVLGNTLQPFSYSCWIWLDYIHFFILEIMFVMGLKTPKIILKIGLSWIMGPNWLTNTGYCF